MAPACAASRAHSVTVVPRRAALTASAVPQAPAPSTQIFMAAGARRCAGAYCVMMRRRRWPAACGLLLLVHGLEVDLGQVHRREAAALDHVGHVAAQVGVDDLRAGDAQDRAHLVVRQVADLEDAGLLGLDQEHGLVLDLGRARWP